MPFNVNNFRTAGLQYGGARPSQFDVTLTAPPGVNLSGAALRKFTFTCQASQLPPARTGTIAVPYFGRKIKIAGDREYDDWNVNIQNDEDWLVRSMFEAWNSVLNTTVGNVRDNKLQVENDYKTDMTITQYAKNGQTIRSYTMVGAWPVEVGAINTDWNSPNEIESFAVQFAYDWWEPVDGAAVSNLDQVKL